MIMQISRSKAVFLTALFIGFLGLLPHALFSLDAGYLTGMEYAWDEHTYANYALLKDGGVYRAFSSFLFKGIYLFFSHDFGMTMAAADFFIPFAVALVAGIFVCACGFLRARDIFVAMVFILFATSFLSFADMNFWGKFLKDVSPFAMAGVYEKTHGVIPYVVSAFFPLYRTPDPQATMIVQMAIISTLFFFSKNKENSRALVFLAILCAFVPVIYITTGVSIIVFLLAYGALGWAANRDIRYAGILLLALLTAGWETFVFYFEMGGGYAASFIYTSHLPMIAPSVLFGLGGVGFVAWQKKSLLKSAFSPGFLSGRQVFSAACFLVPVVTLNQQIVTGMMVRSINWELYANYIFTAAGFLALWPDLPQIKGFKRLKQILPFILVLALILNQGKSYARFVERNLLSLAAADLIRVLRDEGELEGKVILLEDPASEAGLRNRIGEENVPALIPGHLSLLAQQSLLAEKGKDGYQIADMPMKDAGFLLQFYQGETPEAFEKFVTGQIARGVCSAEMQYFFWIKDCWGYLTDFRGFDRKKTSVLVPALVADYRSFLSDRQRQVTFGKIIYLTTDKYPGKERLLLQSVTVGRFKPVTLYAYEDKD